MVCFALSALANQTHAQFSGDANWSALGSGMDNFPYALALSGSDLYAGGSFTTAGGNTANCIAKWNGSGWSVLGSGMNGDVLALAVSGSDLYTGGAFTTAGGNAANNIAKWDGNSWSALGSGLGGGTAPVVRARAVSGDSVYAGGSFTIPGGNALAKWNGTNWSPVGSGIGGNSSIFPDVLALAASGSDLYVGGSFTRVTNSGGATVTANRIAKWNGTNWSALGSGIGGTPNGLWSYVHVLAVSGSNLYAGGYFTNAGGNTANYIAKWDGSNWSTLGSGMSLTVFALAVSANDVYAAGYFTNAGGNTANNIAKWNGSSWSALGSGIGGNSPVAYALAASGDSLYVGGEFTTAGSKVAARIAKARIGCIVRSISVTNSVAFVKFSGVTGYDYQVQRASSLNAPVTWTTITTDPLSPDLDGSFSFTDTNAPLGQAFYRTVQP